MIEPVRYHDEKRNYRRMRIERDLTFNIFGENTMFKGFCQNLSHTGIQFDSTIALPKGKLVEITIDSGTEKFKPMKATVDIVRIVENADSQYTIAGKIIKYQ